jgi:hypothetical protein
MSDDDFDDDEPGPLPSVPGLARAAGIIWIVYGIGGLCTTILGFVLQAGNQAAGGANAAGPGGGNPSSPCCSIAITITFAYCGMQTIKGQAKDTLGNSIGSLVLGLLQFSAGVFFLLAGAEVFGNGIFDPTFALIVGAVLLFMGSMLLLAATLGLMGRRAYLDWRAIAHPKKKRRRPRRDEEEDEDDEEDDDRRRQ